MNQSKSPVSLVPAVERTVAVIRYLSDIISGTPADIAKTLRAPRVGVMRILKTLQHLGIVTKDDDTGKYALTRLLFSLSARAPGLDIRRVARPCLESLRDASGETAELAIRDGDEMLLADAMDSPSSVRLFARPGSMESLYRMATGKVLLAALTDDRIRHLHKNKLLIAKPKYQPSSFNQLMDEIRQIREQGYAFDRKDAPDEVQRIAAPVRDDTGTVVAAIGIAGPACRLTLTRERIRLVVQSAELLSRSMGAI
ncbi:MAG: IclR family transcriptional regulator [Planctomycetota bacterium]